MAEKTSEVAQGKSRKRSSKKQDKPLFAKEYGIEAYERIADIAKNSDNEKLRFDANKWLVEMAFGKATQATEIEGNVSTGAIKVEFKGDLKEWAE